MEDYQCLRQNAKPQLSSFMFALHVDVALSAGILLSFLAFSSKTSVHSNNCCDRTLHPIIVVHSYIWTIDIIRNNLLVVVSVVVSVIVGIVSKKALGLWKQPHPTPQKKNIRRHTVHSITLMNTFALYHIMTWQCKKQDFRACASENLKDSFSHISKHHYLPVMLTIQSLLM